MSVRPEVLAALRFLQNRSREPLSLQDVAEEVGYSPFHLTRTFKQHVGQAPMQFLAARRFYDAKRLLLSSTASVTDICMEVGFSSLGTFSRRFVDEVGLTPSEFRRLPDQLSDQPVLPMHRRGPGPWELRGRIRLSAESAALLGDHPIIFVGLFPDRAARGTPVCGSRLLGPGAFCFTGVPQGRYWLLAGAFGGDLLEQLLPERPVTGGVPEPISVPSARVHDVVMQLPGHWETPITVALPALTSPVHAPDNALIRLGERAAS